MAAPSARRADNESQGVGDARLLAYRGGYHIGCKEWPVEPGDTASAAAGPISRGRRRSVAGWCILGPRFPRRLRATTPDFRRTADKAPPHIHRLPA